LLPPYVRSVQALSEHRISMFEIRKPLFLLTTKHNKVICLQATLFIMSTHNLLVGFIIFAEVKYAHLIKLRTRDWVRSLYKDRYSCGLWIAVSRLSKLNLLCNSGANRIETIDSIGKMDICYPLYMGIMDTIDPYIQYRLFHP